MPRAQPSRTQRKKPEPAVTRAFLFSDLRDHTSFVEAKGDAAAARLLRDYRTLVRREVARHDGADVKTEGDSWPRRLSARSMPHMRCPSMSASPAPAHRYAVACVRIACVRSPGSARAPIARRTRAFAERAGAKWWLSVLEQAGL